MLAGFLQETSLECVPLFSAAAWPAGPPDAHTAEILLSDLERELRLNKPLDGVLLNLHGAMVSEGHPDMELDTVLTVRDVLGDVPIGCVLDLHAIPSPALVASVDVAIAYRTYPHVDMFERGVEVARLISKQLRGRRLTLRIAKVPILTTPLAQATGNEPMRSLLSMAQRVASENALVHISLLPGFPYSDVARAGFSIVGVADTRDAQALEECLDSLAAQVERRQGDFQLERPGPREAVEQAVQAKSQPVVIADIADNVGGGGPGDGTVLLNELLRQGATKALVTLADAEAARTAAAAGVGSYLNIKVGGKLDRMHGESVEETARVIAVTDGRYVSKGSYLTGQSFSSGTTVWLEMGGIDLVVTERAIPPFHSELVTQTGIDPSSATIITAKGAVAWRSAFSEIAGEVIEADTPGVTPLHPEVLPRSAEPKRVVASCAGGAVGLTQAQSDRPDD